MYIYIYIRAPFPPHARLLVLYSDFSMYYVQILAMYYVDTLMKLHLKTIEKVK